MFQKKTATSLCWIFQQRLLFTAKPKCNPVFKAAENCCVFPEASANLTVKVRGWEWEFALNFAADRIVLLNLTPTASLKHKKTEGSDRGTVQKMTC